MVLFQTVFDLYEKLFKLVISLANILPQQLKMSALAQPGIVSRLQFGITMYSTTLITPFELW
jgi:hypothetical protein